MNLNIFVPGLESYMEDINITNNVNTEPEEAPVEEAPAETAEEVDEQKEELFVSFWK